MDAYEEFEHNYLIDENYEYQLYRANLLEQENNKLKEEIRILKEQLKKYENEIESPKVKKLIKERDN